MKKIYVSLFLSAIIFFLNSPIFSQSNYITLGNLGTTSFCPNGTLSVPFTTNMIVGTFFRVYVSESNGSFGYQVEIGHGTTSPIEITFPNFLYYGTNYRIKIESASPVVTSNVSPALSTLGQQLSIKINNLVNKEFLNATQNICNGSTLTGNIISNQLGGIYEWKKDGVFLTNNSQFKMSENGVYTATYQLNGCGTVNQTIRIVNSPQVYNFPIRVGPKFQCTGTSIIYRNYYFSDSAVYQWKKNGTLIVGEIKDTLIANQTGIYKSEVTDKCPVIDDLNQGSGNTSGVVFGNVIYNEIYGNNGSGPQTLCGRDMYFDLLQLSGEKNPLVNTTYQWKRNGINIPNATTNYLSPIKEGGIYSLQMTQGNCNSISNGIIFIKKDTLKLSLSVLYQYSKDICPGTYTYFNTFNGYGLNPVLYKNGIATQLDLVFNNPIYESGKYTISGTSTGCVILPSDTLTVTVGNKIIPSILNHKPTVCSGYHGQLSTENVFFSSTTPVQFQWFKNNQPIPGLTSSIMYPVESGFYKVRLSSGSCSGFSDSTEVKVASQIPKPNFIGQYSNPMYTCNATVIRFRNANYDNLSSYESLVWKKNGQIFNILDGDEPYWVYQSGTYTVVGKQGTCETESDPVEIKIGEPITANITGSTSIYPGQKAKLNLNFTGGNAWSYQTSDVGTGQTTSLSPTLKNVSPSSTQTYSITSVASNCGVGTITGNATVTVLPCPTDKTISLNSGNWNTATTWTCGQIPTAAYDAIIENGHTVTLPNGYQGETKKLDLRGGLKQNVGSSLKVNQ